MVMELCDGEDLGSMVKRARESRCRINDGLIGLWVHGIADALRYLHDRGIIHRDLKGDNVLLRRMVPKVADFGLATVSAATHGAAGAYAYESPEQAHGVRAALPARRVAPPCSSPWLCAAAAVVCVCLYRLCTMGRRTSGASGAC